MKKLIALMMMLLLVVGSFAACGGVEGDLKGLVSDLEDAINDKDGEKLLDLFMTDKIKDEFEKSLGGVMDIDELGDQLLSQYEEEIGDEKVKIEYIDSKEYEGEELDEKVEFYETTYEIEIEAYAEIQIETEFDGETEESEMEAYKYDGKWYLAQ